MPFKPGASWFVPFYEHDPSTDKQCIYFTQRQARCRMLCQETDNEQAIELYEIISGLPAEAVSIELIKDYILCNCCRFDRAQHRERIEDVGLWTPLAKRWLDEIRRHATEQSSRTVSDSLLEESAIPQDAATIPGTPTPSHATTVCTTPTPSLPYFQLDTPTSSSIDTTPPTSVASSFAYQESSPKTPTHSAATAPLPYGGQLHSDLPPLDTDVSTDAILVQPTSISEPPLSEFRAHIAEPGPADSVASKIQDTLVGRDFETGSLYIFNRNSSPGHVKIGWTARSVERRLESWSTCGYTPNLLFVENRVPHAQRAETLAHYEMIKEWRRERQCQAEHCGKSHQEWFEVSQERAKEVLGDWAKFMKIAEPYHPSGLLKEHWEDFVIRTEKDRGTVTAKKLLEQYEQFLAEDTTPMEKSVTIEKLEKVFDVDELVDQFSRSLAKQTWLEEEAVELGRGLTTEEQEGDLGNTPKKEELENPKITSVHLGSLRTDQSVYTREFLPKNEVSLEPISLAGISLPSLKKQPKRDPLILFKAPPDFQFSFAAELPSKEKPISKIEKPFTIEPTAKSQFSFIVEPPIKETSSQINDAALIFEPPPEPQLYPAEPQPNGMTEDLKPETLPRPEFSCTSGSPFRTKPLPEPTVFVKPENSPKAQFSFASKMPFRFEPSTELGTLPKTDFTFTSKSPVKFEPSTEAGTLPRTTFTFTSKSPFKFKPSIKAGTLPTTDFTFTSELPIKSELSTEAATLPRTDFTFTSKSQFKFEPSWETSAPFVSDSLVWTEPFLKIKPPHEGVPAKGVPADEELSPEHIPLPPSPILQPVDSQYTPSVRVTEPGPSLDIEIQSITDTIKNFHI